MRPVITESHGNRVVGVLDSNGLGEETSLPVIVLLGDVMRWRRVHGGFDERGENPMKRMNGDSLDGMGSIPLQIHKKDHFLN